MKSVRNLGLALVAGSVLVLGSAYAQDTAKKPEAKPQAKHQHRMGKMHGCPEHQDRGTGAPSEHDHS